MSADNSPRRWLLVTGLVGVVVLALFLDPWVAEYLREPDIYDSVIASLVRVLGLLVFWVVLGVTLTLSTSQRLARDRTLLVIGAPLLSNLLAIILKLIIRRERPAFTPGLIDLGTFTTSPLYTGAYSMPSVDAAIAAAGCTILGHLWPRTRWLWAFLAILCAAGRAASGAHYLSDVTVGSVLGWLVASALWRKVAREDRYYSRAIATQ